MRRMFRFLIIGGLLFAIAFFAVYAQGPAHLTTDPGKALFVYDDIDIFLAAYKLLAAGGDVEKILQENYLDRGTRGLKMFIRKYELDARRLARAIRDRPGEYGSLDGLESWLRSQEPAIREAFKKLKKIIPQAVFPPTYYVIGSYRGIASASEEGQLVSVEKFDKNKKHLDTLVVHELAHFQQVMAVGIEKYRAVFGPEKSLLALCIREGTAEFFADLVTGKITQEEARGYVIEHERSLWRRFEKEMSGRETGDWMWQSPADPKQPPHVGYALGCRIVKAYYERAEDKARAVKEILAVTDYPAFLEKSGYAQRFHK